MNSCSCLYSIICLCQIILISSEKKSLHNNKYQPYLNNNAIIISFVELNLFEMYR